METSLKDAEISQLIYQRKEIHRLEVFSSVDSDILCPLCVMKIGHYCRLTETA